MTNPIRTCSMITGMDIRARLRDCDLPDKVARLGFRGPDVTGVLEAASIVAEQPADVGWIAKAAGEIIARIGDVRPWYPSEWEQGTGARPSTGSGHMATGSGHMATGSGHMATGSGHMATGSGHLETGSGQMAGGSGHIAGLLPMLALVVTAPEVAAFHAQRGVPTEVSEATLGDLGQQVWVHRLTCGEFGLHTQTWLTRAWCGALYWLGRLQFELHRTDEEWLLSVHIPRTGPLTPTSVDDALAMATAFFASHFPDYPTRDFFCESWLLDPQLAIVAPHSNLADFQQRWTLFGEGRPGDDDVLFFVFNRRGQVDHASLPRDTGLRRAIIDGWAAGRHWTITQGRLPQNRGENP